MVMPLYSGVCPVGAGALDAHHCCVVSLFRHASGSCWACASSEGVGGFCLVGGQLQLTLFSDCQEGLDSVCQGLVQLEHVRLLGQLESFHLGLAGIKLLVSPAV